MTNEEIIKALECCVLNDCSDCPYREANDGYSCITELMEDVFELHKSQQAEIENADFTIEQLTKGNLQLQAEIERLEGTVGMYEEERKYHFEMSRQKIAEAIKEFAKTVRGYIKSYCNPYGKPIFDYDTSVKIMHFIDNLVKEMVGDDK